MGVVTGSASGFRRLDGVVVGVRCPHCGRAMHFVRTVKGGRMPCEMELVQGDGAKTLVTPAGVTVRKAAADVWGYEPHWGFCRFGREDKSKCKEVLP
jgi:hypothetical protein